MLLLEKRPIFIIHIQIILDDFKWFNWLVINLIKGRKYKDQLTFNYIFSSHTGFYTYVIIN